MQTSNVAYEITLYSQARLVTMLVLLWYRICTYFISFYLYPEKSKYREGIEGKISNSLLPFLFYLIVICQLLLIILVLILIFIRTIMLLLLR